MLLLTSMAVWAQQITVKGIVTDAQTKEGIPGVSVRVKNAPSGTITDVNGAYSLQVLPDAVLLFCSVGFDNKSIRKGQTQLNVTLGFAENILEQVVVVGYGSQRKVDITGSTNSIKGEDLLKMPVMTQLKPFRAGLRVWQIISSGKPGSSPSIRVRGTGTALAGTSTLFVVDGVLTDDISNINNSDIVNIDILKDASATAIYGARGANGVVIITTKRGQTGKLKVDYSLNTGWRSASNLVKMANNTEYANYVSAATSNVVNAGAFQPTGTVR
ncbi:MAG: TonB-dependent receptor plug domain-containing protein [Cytophagaceae bacterium]|nr:TonB-dependent receptor plug domain-containing protein [Cytophagaceae bacterium]